jgi:hypothetical protein
MAAAVASILLGSGYKPAVRAYSYLQYNNIHLRLIHGTMTIGDPGGEDAAKYMNTERYVGEYALGDITVKYPEGCRETAMAVARAFAETWSIVKRDLGVDWSFRLELRLAHIPDNVTNLRYEQGINRSRNRNTSPAQSRRSREETPQPARPRNKRVAVVEPPPSCVTSSTWPAAYGAGETVALVMLRSLAAFFPRIPPTLTWEPTAYGQVPSTRMPEPHLSS